MTLQEMIYRRKSCRSFTNVPVGEDVIRKIRPLCRGTAILEA